MNKYANQLCMKSPSVKIHHTDDTYVDLLQMKKNSS